MKRRLFFLTAIFATLGSLLLIWVSFFLRGKRFARRDRLQKADAIVVLAGTRGNIKFLNGKIQTATHLYQQGWAPYIVCAGQFSMKVTDSPSLITMETLRTAVVAGRIQEKDIASAVKMWDTGLGAIYMREQAIHMGVPPQDVVAESESLHTRENAEYVLDLLKQQHMKRIILVTSPFHQLRTYLTFAKVFQSQQIEIINYYADTGEWHPATWFLTAEHRKLVQSEMERIKLYRKKGDLL